MKWHRFKSVLLAVSAAVLSWAIVSCGTTPHLVGAWRQIGEKATLEFFEDGSFEAVDNQGMAVSGTFTPLDGGKMRFEILHPDASVETVILNVSVRDGELTVVGEGPGGEERYRRLKP